MSTGLPLRLFLTLRDVMWQGLLARFVQMPRTVPPAWVMGWCAWQHTPKRASLAPCMLSMQLAVVPIGVQCGVTTSRYLVFKSNNTESTVQASPNIPRLASLRYRCVVWCSSPTWYVPAAWELLASSPSSGLTTASETTSFNEG